MNTDFFTNVYLKPVIDLQCELCYNPTDEVSLLTVTCQMSPLNYSFLVNNLYSSPLTNCFPIITSIDEDLLLNFTSLIKSSLHYSINYSDTSLLTDEQLSSVLQSLNFTSISVVHPITRPFDYASFKNSLSDFPIPIVITVISPYPPSCFSSHMLPLRSLSLPSFQFVADQLFVQHFCNSTCLPSPIDLEATTKVSRFDLSIKLFDLVSEGTITSINHQSSSFQSFINSQENSQEAQQLLSLSQSNRLLHLKTVSGLTSSFYHYKKLAGIALEVLGEIVSKYFGKIQLFRLLFEDQARVKFIDMVCQFETSSIDLKSLILHFNNVIDLRKGSSQEGIETAEIDQFKTKTNNLSSNDITFTEYVEYLLSHLKYLNHHPLFDTAISKSVLEGILSNQYEIFDSKNS
ncbi:hypothetical protein GEMRC1_003639 [Eukaryota sp. GEM-RC1]